MAAPIPSLARLENRKLHNDSEFSAAVLKLAGAGRVGSVRCSLPSGPGCWWSKASRWSSAARRHDAGGCGRLLSWRTGQDLRDPGAGGAARPGISGCPSVLRRLPSGAQRGRPVLHGSAAQVPPHADLLQVRGARPGLGSLGVQPRRAAGAASRELPPAADPRAWRTWHLGNVRVLLSVDTFFSGIGEAPTVLDTYFVIARTLGLVNLMIQFLLDLLSSRRPE